MARDAPLVTLVTSEVGYSGFRVNWTWEKAPVHHNIQLAEYIGDGTGQWYYLQLSSSPKFDSGSVLGVAYEGVQLSAAVRGFISTRSNRFELLNYGTAYYVRLLLASFSDVQETAISGVIKVELQQPVATMAPSSSVFRLLIPERTPSCVSFGSSVFLTGSWVSDSLNGVGESVPVDVSMTWSINGKPCYGCTLFPTASSDPEQQIRCTPVRVATCWKPYFHKNLLELLADIKIAELEGLARWLPPQEVPSSPYNLWTEDNLSLHLEVYINSNHPFGPSAQSSPNSVSVSLELLKSAAHMSASTSGIPANSTFRTLYGSGRLENLWKGKCVQPRPKPLAPVETGIRGLLSVNASPKDALHSPALIVESPLTGGEGAEETRRAKLRELERLRALERARQHEREKLRKQQELKRTGSVGPFGTVASAKDDGANISPRRVEIVERGKQTSGTGRKSQDPLVGAEKQPQEILAPLPQTYSKQASSKGTVSPTVKSPRRKGEIPLDCLATGKRIADVDQTFELSAKEACKAAAASPANASASTILELSPFNSVSPLTPISD